MSEGPAPVSHSAERSTESTRGGRLLYYPVALPGPGPEVREAKQVEGAGPCATLVARRRGGSTRFSEFDQPCLLRVKGQAVPAASLRQHPHEPSRVVLVGEEQERVVRIADHRRATSQPQ